VAILLWEFLFGKAAGQEGEYGILPVATRPFIKKGIKI
jgi:hypothetical protein